MRPRVVPLPAPSRLIFTTVELRTTASVPW